MTYSAVQMKQARLELRVTQDLLDAIDAARGDVSRTRWVERALERALGAEGHVPERAVPASPRAPEASVVDQREAAMDRQRRLNERKAK